MQVPPGQPVGTAVTTSIGTGGGVVTSADGRLAIAIPSGAVQTATQFSVQPITSTAPNGVGGAYRLEPSGTRFAKPIAITFRTDALQVPTRSLGVVYQDPSGYWVKVTSVLRNTTARLVTASSLHLSDWTLVPSDPTQDMAGTFTVNSSVNVATPFTAAGDVSLAYTGEDATERVYLLSGTATLQPVSLSGQACTPDAATKNLTPNVTESFKTQPQVWWAASALWDLTCGTSPNFIEMVFDTGGFSHVGCAHGYTTGTPPPIVTGDQLQGDYTIDCTSQGTGTLRVTWDYLRCGGACTSTNPCATAAAYSCTTSGTPTCTVTSTAAIGTSCTINGTAGVCNSAGTCVQCSQGATCTSTNPCVATATVDCSTGAPVCTAATYQAAGTACTSGTTTGVCNGSGTCVQCTQGAACTSTNPCATSATIDCSTGAPVCKDQTFATAGTACTSGTTTGVCSSSGTCTACTQGATCTSTNPCATSATIGCSTGTPVCTDQTFATAGTACTSGSITGVCSASGTCNACSQGAACTSTNPCATSATTDCSTGTPVCTDQTFATAGTACTTSGGATGVCSSSGTCTACTQGAACTSTNVCAATATVDCSTGTPVCTAQTFLVAGTSCTDGTTTGVCSSTGTCTACTPGATCTSTNPCAMSATISCSTGAPVCTDTAFQPDGTVCGSTTTSVCVGGTCEVCVDGTSCVPSTNPCDVGSMQCGTTPTCVDTGVAVTCPTGQTCTAGKCQ